MKYIKWFDKISLKDLSSVGGKTSSLGEMYTSLSSKHIKVPNGFAITSKAYFHYLKSNDLEERISTLLGDSEKYSKAELSTRSEEIRNALINAVIPSDLEGEILQSFRELKDKEGDVLSVAIRSSATAEDLPDASFAGQQESYLNVRTEAELLQMCRYCFASLYTERAVSYRQDKGISESKIALSICIQKMVRTDLSCSGVMFTLETESGFKDAVVINATWGLGENIVKGVINPDEYITFKPTLKKGARPILRKKLGRKEYKMVYEKGAGKTVKNIETPSYEKQQFCLSDDEIIQLSKLGMIIEEHYSDLKGDYSPMDIEWGKDGLNGELYILQARPETIHSQLNQSKLDVYKLNGETVKILSGDSVGHRIGQGKVRVINNVGDLKEFKEGEILVAEKTEPDWEPYLKKSAAIITDRGGRTCHAAIVSRELGIPAIVGTNDGTTKLKTGQEVTVSCVSGDVCYVYEGIVPYDHKIVDIDTSEKTQTAMMMNLANPSIAFKSSFIPNDGVGLARMEFIINNSINIHPMALIHPEKVTDKKVVDKINELTSGHDEKKSFFVDNLAYGISTIAAAFYPKDVIIRLSDFKTNEYEHLLGGEFFEQKEENPMIGFRGAFRYYHERYREAFALECEAIKKVREEMGLTNLKVMVPFCRTLKEGEQVLGELEKHGLKRGVNDLEIYVMCEIPSNAILAEEFADLFDGFSIGSNDLTQLTLGVDRNSEILSPLFNEDDPAVLKMIELAIDGAHKKGRKIGLCGQRPSDDPKFAKFLVNKGIDSISLNPDAVIEVTEVVKKIEKET